MHGIAFLELRIDGLEQDVLIRNVLEPLRSQNVGEWRPIDDPIHARRFVEIDRVLFAPITRLGRGRRRHDGPRAVDIYRRR